MPCAQFLVGSRLWLVAVESRGCGLGGGGLCRHQDGAIRVAVAVAVIWTVLACSALDAVEELVDS